MKQSDIFTIIIIASVGTLVAFLGVNAFLGDPDKAYVQYKTIQPISAELVAPDPELFNPSSINPTVEVYVGNCEDVDQNGILSQAELIQCESVKQNQTQTDENQQNQDQSQLDLPGEEINNTENTQTFENMSELINSQAGGN